MAYIYIYIAAEIAHTRIDYSLAGQTFARKTGRSGDISIPAFVTLPKSGNGQSDRGTGNRVHSAPTA